MANWVRDFLTENPAFADLPVVKKAKHSIHFDVGDGFILAEFTGAPIFDTETWEPLDTQLLLGKEGNYGAPGIPVLIDGDGKVSITKGTYAHQAVRIGLFNPLTHAFSFVQALGKPLLDGDRFVRTGANYQHFITLHEAGVREELVLDKMPSGNSSDWFVIESIVYGNTFPEGLVDKYILSSFHFPAPFVYDAMGERAPAKRFARMDGTVQKLYTGIPLSWMEKATFPVTIDPDFSADLGDCSIHGKDASYAVARATTFNLFAGSSAFDLGQRFAASNYYTYRGFIKFDTSSIPDGDDVSQVNLRMACTNDYSTQDYTPRIYDQDWSAQDPLDDTNREAAYDNALGATFDNTWRSTSGMAVNTLYPSSNLNTAWVNKTGFTYYSIQSDRENAGTTPTTAEWGAFAAQDNTTAGYRPRLAVAYAAPPTQVKKFMSVAQASLKKVEGVANASAKTISRVANV